MRNSSFIEPHPLAVIEPTQEKPNPDISRIDKPPFKPETQALMSKEVYLSLMSSLLDLQTMHDGPQGNYPASHFIRDL